MFGFNRNRGIFNRYNNYNNYNNYDNYGPFGGYDHRRMREESFIRKYIIFKIVGRILGFLFVLAILFSFFRSQNRQNNVVTNNNSYNKSNIVYIEETRM